ncbi:MAG: hypothetical protein AABZ30_10465 [Myxococcota bacterium]
MPHPVETKFNAPASDILDAIERGFRAQIDIKGKLAELYLSRHLDALKAAGVIDRYEWHDRDGVPDFEVFKGKHRLVVECKNVRSGDGHAGDNWATVELQKTRGGLDAQGRKTRGYRVGHFDILGACLFNQTGKWAFRFVQAQHLARRPDDAEVFVVIHRLPYADERGWRGDLAAVIEQEIAERAKVSRRRPGR